MRLRRWYLWLFPVALLGLGALSWRNWPALETVSVEDGRAYFHHRDLGTARLAGMPHALFLALLEQFPDELGGDIDAFCRKFGAFLDPEEPSGLPVGFLRLRDPATGTDFLSTTCALCHSALLDGRRVDGLGNRNLRMNALENTLLLLAADARFRTATMVSESERMAAQHRLPWTWRSPLVVEDAVRRMKRNAAAELSKPGGGIAQLDAGPGRNTPIEFAKLASGVPLAPPFGFTKIPAVWTYRHRRTFGVDGSMEGDLALAAVEFNKGLSAKEILEHPERWQSLGEYMRSLRPPRYPGPIDEVLAERGQLVYAESCVRCHGGGEEYEENLVLRSAIGTDPDRVLAVTPELVRVRRATELAKHIKPRPRDGYVPPPLDGIWCRGPFLHNGSVPTLEDLLRPVAERPMLFPIGFDTAYDPQRLGLLYEEETTAGRRRIGKYMAAVRYQFDTRTPGNSNAGHLHGTRLSVEEKRGLLEYLKTR